MKIVIDGYNVLRAIKPGKYSTDKDREWFISELAKYGKRKGHTIELIFDGGFMAMRETQRQGSVHIVYVGYQHLADDYIMQYLDEHHNEQVLLVTNDREIIDHAGQYDIPHIGAMTFFNYVQAVDALKQTHTALNGSVHKLRTTPDEPKLDQLMKQADVSGLSDEDDSQPSRMASARKPSKRQKRLNALLRKL